MVCFNKGWEPNHHLPITQKMAQEFLMSFLPKDGLQISLPPSISPLVAPEEVESIPTPSVQAAHIGGYIDFMMNTKEHKILDITITKDGDGNLIFEIVNKEK